MASIFKATQRASRARHDRKCCPLRGRAGFHRAAYNCRSGEPRIDCAAAVDQFRLGAGYAARDERDPMSRIALFSRRSIKVAAGASEARVLP